MSATTTQNAVKARAAASLRDSLGAVSQAIEAMPVRSRARSMRDAFMRSDAVLSMLNKEILEARGNLAQLYATFGPNDPMAEALAYQLTALEAAYAQRLMLLRKKREEGSRDTKYKEFTAIEKNLRDVRAQDLVHRRRDNGALWLLAFLMSRGDRTSAKRESGHVLNAA